jgi:hypothetical protein
MAINYGRLRSLAARQIISALIRDGFAFDRAADLTKFIAMTTAGA